MKIGAVTVTYNSGEVIEGFLRSLLAQTHGDFILYVVDNASRDDTLGRVARCHDPRIVVIANTTNAGIAEANNQGIRAALASGCDAVLLINNDTEFEPALVRKLVSGLQESGCDMIAPKILYHDNRQLIWSAGGGFNPLKGYAGFHYGLNQVDRGQFDTPRRVDHAPACCLLVRRSVFSRVGLMDDRYFVYLDDTDFCYRARRAGIYLRYHPAATLLHKASSLTGGPESEFSVRYRTRNQVYFMLKHLGAVRCLYYLPAYQLFLLLRLIFGRFGFSSYLLRQRAFAEGLRLWMLSRHKPVRDSILPARSC
jgi:GT2 family glycosyltransferase